jgi:hypothetical protein
VAAVPIASQTRKKKTQRRLAISNFIDIFKEDSTDEQHSCGLNRETGEDSCGFSESEMIS